LVKAENSPPLDLTDIENIRWDQADVRKFFDGKRKRLISCDEIADMSATQRMDYVSDVMTCIVLRVHECDTTLIDRRVPPENETCLYDLTFEVLAVVLITIQVS